MDDMAPARTRSVRLDSDTDERVMRILAHMKAADPYRDTNDTDAIRVLIRRGAAAYEAEHGLPGPEAATGARDATAAPSKARTKKGAKRARKP